MILFIGQSTFALNESEVRIMGIIEIIGGLLIVVLSVIVIAAVTMMDPKGNGITSALGGGDNGSFFGKNQGQTKEAMLVRAATICGSAMVVLVIIVLFASFR